MTDDQIEQYRKLLESEIKHLERHAKIMLEADAIDEDELDGIYKKANGIEWALERFNRIALGRG